VLSDSSADIASRAVRGSFYSLTAAGVTITLGFARSVLLARLLLPEHFGVVTLAMFYVALAAKLQALGLDQALIHRQDTDETIRRTYFTLRIGTVLLSSLLVVAAAPVLGYLYPAMPLLAWVLLALIGVEIVKSLSTVQETMLGKDLAFRQLAITDVVASVVMTAVAPFLAWLGWGVWALVAEQASGILARLGMTWGIFRRWSPHVGWDRAAVRWFWEYGKPTWGASNLNLLLDRFDDFWIGTTLGKTPLGYYSRAYEFARYPRRVVADSLVSVFNPVFARLQKDRLHLSQAFYRTAYIILRSGFLISGAFALVMPEFIHVVIGDQWAPMLLTFRLMLIYTLLDALLMMGGNLLFAIGRPHLVQRTTMVQALFFIPAVVLGAQFWGINGVALAADGMLVLGGMVLYRYLRQVVDFSLLRLVLWPTLALGVAWSAGLVLEAGWQVTGAWEMAIGKLVLFSGLYLTLLLALERGDALQGFRWAWVNLRPGGRIGVT
jgi:O-antigen/teichoic acid export membrane protein